MGMGRYENKDETPYVPILSEIEEALDLTTYKYKVTDTEEDDEAEGYGSSRTEANEDAFRELKKDDSCCYITTSCLNAMSIPQEQSLELKAMKIMTKKHI